MDYALRSRSVTPPPPSGREGLRPYIPLEIVAVTDRLQHRHREVEAVNSMFLGGARLRGGREREREKERKRTLARRM